TTAARIGAKTKTTYTTRPGRTYSRLPLPMWSSADAGARRRRTAAPMAGAGPVLGTLCSVVADIVPQPERKAAATLQVAAAGCRDRLLAGALHVGLIVGVERIVEGLRRHVAGQQVGHVVVGLEHGRAGPVRIMPERIVLGDRLPHREAFLEQPALDDALVGRRGRRE